MPNILKHEHTDQIISKEDTRLEEEAFEKALKEITEDIVTPEEFALGPRRDIGPRKVGP